MFCLYDFDLIMWVLTKIKSVPRAPVCSCTARMIMEALLSVHAQNVREAKKLQRQESADNSYNQEGYVAKNKTSDYNVDAKKTCAR